MTDVITDPWAHAVHPGAESYLDCDGADLLIVAGWHLVPCPERDAVFTAAGGFNDLTQDHLPEDEPELTVWCDGTRDRVADILTVEGCWHLLPPAALPCRQRRPDDSETVR